MDYKKFLTIFLIAAIFMVTLSCVSADDGTPLLSDGTYEVGDDLDAGEYYVKCNTYNLYIEVSSDDSGDLDSVIYNLNTHGGVYITVEDGEFLKIQGGDLYELKDSPNRGAEDGHYKDGMYKVGDDIPAGDYKVKSTEEQGYIEITKNSRHQIEDIVTNDNFKTTEDVTLKDGQYIFLRNGAQIDVDDDADKKSDSKAETVKVEGIKFNVPDGFKEDKSAGIDDYEKTAENNIKYTISQKVYKNADDDKFTLGVITYEDHDVTDDVAAGVGSDKVTINGIKAYKYQDGNDKGIVYAKNGKLVTVIADEDLLKDIVTE